MERMKEVQDIKRSVKNDYMQFADLDEIREMKSALKQELEELFKLKEMFMRESTESPLS